MTVTVQTRYTDEALSRIVETVARGTVNEVLVQ
jgi:hypothetical protein